MNRHFGGTGMEERREEGERKGGGEPRFQDLNLNEFLPPPSTPPPLSPSAVGRRSVAVVWKP